MKTTIKTSIKGKESIYVKVINTLEHNIMEILDKQNEFIPENRKFPVYWNNWKRRLLKLKYLAIDLKYWAIK